MDAVLTREHSLLGKRNAGGLSTSSQVETTTASYSDNGPWKPSSTLKYNRVLRKPFFFGGSSHHCRERCPDFAQRDQGELPKINIQIGSILEKRTTECASNDNIPLPSPRPTNVLVQEYLGAAKPSMAQT